MRARSMACHSAAQVVESVQALLFFATVANAALKFELVILSTSSYAFIGFEKKNTLGPALDSRHFGFLMFRFEGPIGRSLLRRSMK
ncbi:hypothetical protein B0H11DRAFT_960758 [Mycena galericulata]|nr:hypothetical protein B0H11DRAFT_960758 [Mycena galericulata]